MRTYKYNWSRTEDYSDNAELRKSISEALNISEVTSQLLMNRGCLSISDAEAFLTKSEVMLHDPFLLDDMEKAALKIYEAVQNNEKIVVYGDYDVDGVTSVCTLLTYLKKLTDNVSYYIPNRAGEGYGISTDIVRAFAKDGISMIITVDTGITAFNEAELCKELGVTLIVTDHHECHVNLPDAYAIVNPRKNNCTYPFKELAGVGVVFKVICAIEKIHSGDDLYTSVKRICKEYIDLVAIGTVADVMPLKDENRLIVAEGLRKIEYTDRLGLISLIDAVSADSKKQSSPKKITSGYISYSVAPRINAAGRISSAGIAVELFLANEKTRADALAQKLCEINRERQQEENEIAKSAREKLEADTGFKDSSVIVLEDEHWHHGIIGIVSSRLTERFGKPSILISFDGSSSEGESPEDIGKGSGRSVKGMNLVDALRSCDDLLEKYGGHELAAGLSIKRKNLPALRERLDEYAKRSFAGADITPGFEYDMEISSRYVTMDQVSELYLLEPFGVSNPQPIFVIRGLTVVDYCTVGAGKHTKFNVKCGKSTITVMCFRHIPEDYDIYPGDTVDILFSLDVNEFQGHKNLQFIAKDLRLSEDRYYSELALRERYSKILSSLDPESTEYIELSEDEVPSRDDCGFVYNLLKNELRVEREVYSVRAFLHLIGESGGNIGYVKLRFILKILDELGLIRAYEADTELEKFIFTYIHVKERTSLDRSPTYRALHDRKS